MSCHDKFLVSHILDKHFPSMQLQALPNADSNYLPLLPSQIEASAGPFPFKIENMWLEVSDFKNNVQQWWKSYKFVGTTGYILAYKFKSLKQDIKKWNVEVLGRVNSRKRECLDKI